VWLVETCVKLSREVERVAEPCDLVALNRVMLIIISPAPNLEVEHMNMEAPAPLKTITMLL